MLEKVMEEWRGGSSGKVFLFFLFGKRGRRTWSGEERKVVWTEKVEVGKGVVSGFVYLGTRKEKGGLSEGFAVFDFP